MARTPSARSLGTWSFTVSEMSRKRRPVLWRGSRYSGVVSVVTPMNPTFTPARSTIAVGGSSALPSRSTVLGAV